MTVEYINTVQQAYNWIDNAYINAKVYNASRLVFLNTYNPQSTLNSHRYAINILKSDRDGNEQVINVFGTLLEPIDDKIIINAVELYRESDNYRKEIPIEIWTDYSNPQVYW